MERLAFRLEIGAATLCWEVPHRVGDEVVEGLVNGTLLHAYRFERYKPSDDSRRVDRVLVSAHHDISEPVRLAPVKGAGEVSWATPYKKDWRTVPIKEKADLLIAANKAGMEAGASFMQSMLFQVKAT